jgi:glycosyltransferase involved in cell wall biosynthesis
MERFTKKLSVIIPLYNEEDTIGEVLERCHAIKHIHEVIVADDCSSDTSPEIVRSFPSDKIKYIRLHENSGKTAAVNKARQLIEGDLVIIQDADLEYDPSDIESVVRPIRVGEADVVYGSRFLDGERTDFPYWINYSANKLLSYLTKLLYRIDITDVETCYKAFRAPLFKNMELESSGFGMEIEITAMISRLPVRIAEVPISYKGRRIFGGKKIKLKDGIQALWYIFRYRFSKRFSLRKTEYLESISKYLLYR